MDSSGNRFQIGSSSPVNMELALRQRRYLGEIQCPGLGKRSSIRPLPVRLLKGRQRHRCPLHRTHEPDAALDLAIVQHDAWRWDLYRRPARLRIDDQDRVRITGPVQCLGQGERLVALLAADGEYLRLGAGRRMDIDHLALGHHQALGRQRLDADVIGA